MICLLTERTCPVTMSTVTVDNYHYQNLNHPSYPPALSTRMIERIFSGAVTRGTAQKEGRMSYTEFVWFLLSEEDKRHPTAIEYWFRCMDLDGDGILTMYELEFFYEEQLQRMEQLGIETLPYDDCLCQVIFFFTTEVCRF